jgi:hypothetical protein
LQQLKPLAVAAAVFAAVFSHRLVCSGTAIFSGQRQSGF